MFKYKNVCIKIRDLIKTNNCILVRQSFKITRQFMFYRNNWICSTGKSGI